MPLEYLHLKGMYSLFLHWPRCERRLDGERLLLLPRDSLERKSEVCL